jgi:hypothetical protein
MSFPNIVKFIILSVFISIITLAQATEINIGNLRNSDNDTRAKMGASFENDFNDKTIEYKRNFKKTEITQNYFFDERTSIPIYFTVSENTFPESWKTKKINAKGISLTKNEYKRSKEIIIKILKKYPTKVIKENLKAIYILDDIKFYGQTYGGTNSNDVVYLTNKGENKGYDDFYIEQLFHAEFSSVLLRKYSYYFDKEEWSKCNSKDFKYGDGGLNALKNNLTGQDFVEDINKQGLLTQYGMSNLENDFNSFAKNIFLPKRNFDVVLKKYKNLNKKKDLIVKFYEKIDKQFSSDFFDKIIYSNTKTILPGVPLKTEEEPKKVASFIDKRSGIPIYFVVADDTFPLYWRSKTINAKGVSLPKSEYERSKKVIIRALKKYPLTVLNKNLKAIYVLEHLEFYGQLFGGTNSTDTVYLTNKGISMGYTDFYLEQTFHHEFSSIFLRNYPYYFDKELWLNTNAKGFKYGDGGVNALKTGKTGQYFDSKINKMGLLSQYSTSDMENDLNNFAQNIFLPHKDFADLLIKYERLNQKYKILVDFYTKIDKGFTKDFFDKIIFPAKDTEDPDVIQGKDE